MGEQSFRSGAKKERRDGRVIVGPDGVENLVFEEGPENLRLLAFTVAQEGKKIEVTKGGEYRFEVRSTKNDPHDERYITGIVDYMSLSSLWAGSPDDARRAIDLKVKTPKIDRAGMSVKDRNGNQVYNYYSLTIPGSRDAAGEGGSVIKSISPR